MLAFTPNQRLFAISLLSAMVMSGCQVVSLKQQDLNVTIANERNSILTQKKLSEASLNVLSMSGKEAKVCMQTPDECIADLHKIPQIQDEQLLSTSSELYLSKAMSLSDSSECKVSKLSKHKGEEQQKTIQKTYEQCLDQELEALDKSIRYSYAYLFKTARQPQERIFDNRQVQIRDFYNQALTKLVNVHSLRNPAKTITPTIKIGKSIYTIDIQSYQRLQNMQLEKFISSYNMNFSGLRAINRRDGFGSDFVAVFPSSENTAHGDNKYILDPLSFDYPNGVNPNIHKARYLAATIIAQPKNAAATINDVLNNPNFEVKVYDPYSVEKVSIAGKEYSLAANFSAPYGLWLAENNLGTAAYLTLIDRDQHLTMPHLYMLEPYNPNKKVIVLVHGLASSPEAWIAVTNDIMGDPVLREHYQVWQVFYSTNMPILESRFQIYALLKQAFASLNPKDAAAQDAVLIGHSMGGIISRLLVSNADISKEALTMMNSRQQARLRKHPVIGERLKMEPIANFDRAIFLASPHRGTDYADRWFTLAARKIIKLPATFLTTLADTLTSDDMDLKEFVKTLTNDVIQNGPSDLSKKSKFMELTATIPPEKGLVFHSIMGNVTKSNDPELITDGIVPYKSAHLDGAVSEKIFTGGHSIQETPEAVLELRRILREHLVDHGLYKPTKN
ncbi:esterase/lipase family protein [Acinetobacter sp. 1000160]|uniref:esterase/lipase family protein n=1 Tax=Acinetobacter sp. 1000160 TaxID=1310800 RepID=UPI00044E3A30|nr:alpha/beta fold hydrolase [Acinetobacter sp. 1000160]EXB47200.1 alpha/beta hydrolase family protein [Acinetobacter baumannii 146457]EYT23833.1 alpha/beta hydrolase family protein [Acinetobacter sp. 1000160]